MIKLELFRISAVMDQIKEHWISEKLSWFVYSGQGLIRPQARLINKRSNETESGGGGGGTSKVPSEHRIGVFDF